ncbi:MAG: urease [Alteromonadaceae bacterium]|nr:MAG: urease [Alteromonadaceae bacterium]
MLALRPTCENCYRRLLPEATDAYICSYECTFCKQCVDAVLENVCPNCGGGFCPRPIRPSEDLINGNFLGNDPASTLEKHRPVNIAEHREFAERVKGISPENR